MNTFGMKDKIGYLFGDFGNDFFFILVSSFLMVFYTDVFGISPAFVGTLFLIARFWDAFADVTWGRFIDSRKTGKNGKFRPWIFRMSFPLVIAGILMFLRIPGMSTGFYEAYAFVTYILWGTFYSTVNIPYGSMASVITNDPVQRTSLSTYRTMGSMAAQLIIGAVGPLIVFVNNKADANRFFMAAILFGILSIACYMACVKMSTERIVITETQQKQANFGKTIKGLMKNKPLIWILVASLLFMINMMLIGTVNVYLFKDYFGNAKMLSLIGIVQSVSAFVAVPLANPLVRTHGKKEIASVGMALAAIVYLLLFFMPNISATVYVILSAVGMFGFAFFNIVVWAFVTDVIDYHEFLTGLREDGTVYSIYSFARKVGQAIAGGLGGAVIGAIGYNAALKVQPQHVLNGIHSLATLIPAAVYIVVFLILVFLYPLNKKRTHQLAYDLTERRKTGNKE